MRIFSARGEFGIFFGKLLVDVDDTVFDEFES